MDIKKQIANRVRALLNLKKITQPALAKEIGCTSQAVSSWCTGRVTPGYDWLDILCEYFHVPFEYFFTNDERAESILNGTTPKEEMSSVTELQSRLQEMTAAYQQELDEKSELKKKYEKALTNIAGLNGTIERLKKESQAREDYIDRETVNAMARKQLMASAAIMNAVVEMLKEE